MLNIVLDNLETANVWSVPKIRPNQNYIIRRFPTFFCCADISIHNSVDNLDSFIYPVLMLEPYIQARALIEYYSLFGFWAYVPDNVIQGLREKRGWIIIDLYGEPISQNDFRNILTSLSDSSDYPNDRILINTVVTQFADYKRVFNFPSFLEMGCYVNHIQSSPSPCPCNPHNRRDLIYPHKRFLLLNNRIDYHAANLLAKYASEYADSFLDSSSSVRGEKSLRLPQALYATDFNIVPEAYVNFDVIDYPFITEKTFRNIKYKKPFIVMGQPNTLSSFHKLGYRTFSPLIDESYDTIGDTNKRFKKLLFEIDRLRKMSKAEFANLLQQCQPIVEHNYNNLIRRMKQTNTWLEGLKKV